MRSVLINQTKFIPCCAADYLEFSLHKPKVGNKFVSDRKSFPFILRQIGNRLEIRFGTLVSVWVKFYRICNQEVVKKRTTSVGILLT